MLLAPSLILIFRGEIVFICYYCLSVCVRQPARKLLLLLVVVTVGDGDRSFDWIVLNMGFAFETSNCWFFLAEGYGCFYYLFSGLGRLTCILFSRSLRFFRLVAFYGCCDLKSEAARISNPGFRCAALELVS